MCLGDHLTERNETETHKASHSCDRPWSVAHQGVRNRGLRGTLGPSLTVMVRSFSLGRGKVGKSKDMTRNPQPSSVCEEGRRSKTLLESRRLSGRPPSPLDSPKRGITGTAGVRAKAQLPHLLLRFLFILWGPTDAVLATDPLAELAASITFGTGDLGPGAVNSRFDVKDVRNLGVRIMTKEEEWRLKKAGVRGEELAKRFEDAFDPDQLHLGFAERGRTRSAASLNGTCSGARPEDDAGAGPGPGPRDMFSLLEGEEQRGRTPGAEAKNKRGQETPARRMKKCVKGMLSKVRMTSKAINGCLQVDVAVITGTCLFTVSYSSYRACMVCSTS